MKKALVCPNEPVTNGYRIAQVEPAENIFDVAEPLYWMDCSDDVIADRWYFDSTENTIKEVSKLLQSTTSGSQTL
jgi:hypothetical protein